LATENVPHYNLRDQLRLLLGSRSFNLSNLIEVLERLAYYGLRTVLPIYMVLAVEVGGPQFDHVQKGFVYGWWALIQSLVPIMSGGFADRFGYKKTVGISIGIKAAGYLVMAWCVELGALFSAGESTGKPGHVAVLAVFMVGAMLLAIGTAVFKPGIQGIIALSMPPGTKATGWAVFYQFVNVGGFLGPLLAGVMRLLDWKYVFVSCAVAVCLNYFVLLFLKEPEKTGKGFGDASALSVLWYSMIGVWQPRLFCFIVLFSGYWLMFYQLFDILPNFIEDWIDSRAVLDLFRGPFAFFGASVPEEWGGNLPQEYMINLNAGVCMTLAFLAGYLTSRMRAVSAMVLGIGISCVAIWAIGLSMNGWYTLMAIAGFSIGEITASPRKAEYLASLAPPGREGLYLGYVNATQAIGWSLGSVLAGRLYQEGGDKIVLAKRMLGERFGRVPEALESIQKTAVMPELQQALGTDALGATAVLWDTYNPSAMWSVFALIGFSSMIGLLIYGKLVKVLSDKQDWVFGALVIIYTWLIHDEHTFAKFPRYSVGFACGMLLYVAIRKYKPAWLPDGAKSSG
jgi:dipeptide/tripeptide permease